MQEILGEVRRGAHPNCEILGEVRRGNRVTIANGQRSAAVEVQMENDRSEILNSKEETCQQKKYF